MSVAAESLMEGSSLISSRTRQDEDETGKIQRIEQGFVLELTRQRDEPAVFIEQARNGGARRMRVLAEEFIDSREQHLVNGN
jgi:hypothetical protein